MKTLQLKISFLLHLYETILKTQGLEFQWLVRSNSAIGMQSSRKNRHPSLWEINWFLHLIFSDQHCRLDFFPVILILNGHLLVHLHIFYFSCKSSLKNRIFLAHILFHNFAFNVFFILLNFLNILILMFVTSKSIHRKDLQLFLTDFRHRCHSIWLLDEIGFLQLRNLSPKFLFIKSIYVYIPFHNIC